MFDQYNDHYAFFWKYDGSVIKSDINHKRTSVNDVEKARSTLVSNIEESVVTIGSDVDAHAFLFKRHKEKYVTNQLLFQEFMKNNYNIKSAPSPKKIQPRRNNERNISQYSTINSSSWRSKAIIRSICCTMNSSTSVMILALHCFEEENK